MKNTWKWIAVALAVLLVGSWVVTPLLHSFGITTSYMPMMGGFGGGRYFEGGFGGGHMGFPGTGGMMYSGFGAFGGLLLPLVVIGLAVWGGIALIKSATAKKAPASAAPCPAAESHDANCPHCGRIIQPDWNTCPFCGETI
jgi:hypothetical protein